MGGNSCRLSLYSSSEEPLAADAQALVSVDTTPWWTDKMDMTLGGNNVTMRRVYMDASAFVGQEVILALEDYRAGGNWGHAFFDSINTNVDLSEFKFKVDVVEQLADGWGQSKKFAFTDYYQAGESQGDLAYVKEAYEFLVDYYASARSQEDIYTYCELPGDKLSAIVDQYDALSAEAKAIVDRSDDFSYSGYLNHKGEVVYEEDIAINAVGESMINLRAMASGKTSVSGALVVNGGSDSSLLPMVCGLALLLIGGAFVCVFFHLRKKKENK